MPVAEIFTIIYIWTWIRAIRIAIEFYKTDGIRGVFAPGIVIPMILATFIFCFMLWYFNDCFVDLYNDFVGFLHWVFGK